MSSPNKVKGCGFERQVVDIFNQYEHIKARRAWGSNGEALGLDKEVDILVNYEHIKNYTTESLELQCKRIRKLPEWLGMTDKVDAVVMREDRGEAYILMPLTRFIDVHLRGHKND